MNPALDIQRGVLLLVNTQAIDMNTRDPEDILADPDLDDALKPVNVNHAPDAAYAVANRQWQGIPTIERTRGGRIWAGWYSGGPTEGTDNYVVVVRSDDDGQSWSAPVLVVEPPGKVRAYDECLWIDPQGRLWLFWAQSFEWWDGRSGTWAIRCDDPDADKPMWTKPRRLADGIMMNKPTVVSNGDWLLPTAIWECKPPHRPDMSDKRFSNVTISRDNGETFEHLGSADVPGRSFDEHMLVEQRNGDLWMLVRLGRGGIGQSFSKDDGRTWSAGEVSHIEGLDSRFFIRRLRSGNLLLINNHNFADRKNKRCNMTAFVSDDDGKTWQGGLLIDERDSVSYPDATESADGVIYMIHDHARFGDMQILMSVFTEADILAGKLVSEVGRLSVVIDERPAR